MRPRVLSASRSTGNAASAVVYAQCYGLLFMWQKGSQSLPLSVGFFFGIFCFLKYFFGARAPGGKEGRDRVFVHICAGNTGSNGTFCLLNPEPKPYGPKALNHLMP